MTWSCSSIRRALQRTIQEKQSELKQADAEIEQAQAQTRIAKEQNATAAMKTGYDIERAKLDVSKGDTVSRLDNEQAKLAVVDAQQRERELQVEDQIRPDGRGSGRVGQTSQAREGAVRSETCRTRVAESSAAGPRGGNGQHPPELPLGQHVRRPAGFSGRGPRLAGRGNPRAARSLLGAPRSAPGRIRSWPAPTRAGRHRADRSGPRNRLQGAPRQHLGSGED